MTLAKENARRQPGADTSKHFSFNIIVSHVIRQQAACLIVTLAQSGILPAPAAMWLIRHGGSL